MPRFRRLAPSLLLLCGLVAGSAGAGEPPPGGLGSELVAEGLARPVYLTAPKGDDRLFIVEQPGRIRLFRDGGLRTAPFLDISDRVSRVLGYSERGLLGLAFHPDYPEEPCFFVNYTQAVGHDTAIARYLVSEEDDLADPESGEVLLVLDQPFSNHNGGHIAFGPEETPTLYVGMGDGGDQHDPGDRAQSGQSPLGKILRYEASCSGDLVIPEDNPYTGEADPEDEVLDAIWARGLRNPYRFSFDRATGDLYIGDVGQTTLEEIDFAPVGSPGGLNFGWRVEEGSTCHELCGDGVVQQQERGETCDDGNRTAGDGCSANCRTEPDLESAPPDGPAIPCDDPALTRPIHEYPRSSGCSVTGGYVYRGAIAELRGHYFFADWCTQRIWSFRYDESEGVQDFTDRSEALAPVGGQEIGNPTGFGEDGHGELYIVSQGATSGVFRIVPEPGALPLAASSLLGLCLLRRGARRKQRGDQSSR